MRDERAFSAIRRIERALERIEAAAARLPASQEGDELRQLRQVHHALRGKVEGAISQIDLLLATEEQN